MYQKSGHPQSPPHPRPSECASRQAVQIGPNNSNRMVSSSTNLLSNLREMAPTPDRLVCNKIQQQQLSLVCLSSTRPSGLGSGCTQSVLGKSGSICIPTNSHLGQGSGKATEQTLQQAHSDCPRVAKHALVLGSSDHGQSNSTEPSQSTQSIDTALQSDPAQEPDKSKSPCMAPRASAIKEQGFSEAVAARIEVPQRGSTRSVYEAKWTIFTKWCISHQVDFRAPPVKSVADFLMYRTGSCNPAPLMVTGQPSLINWEILPLISAKMKISHVSWRVSPETGPRAGGESPPGTYSWSYTS